jgi:hypothetical protein
MASSARNHALASIPVLHFVNISPALPPDLNGQGADFMILHDPKP